MENIKEIPLLVWAQQRYDPLPSIHTLRRWCREGRICPQPVLVGRDYRVVSDAVYVPFKRPLRMTVLTVLKSKDPIVSKIINGKTS